jgi:hypothetical protein
MKSREIAEKLQAMVALGNARKDLCTCTPAASGTREALQFLFTDDLLHVLAQDCLRDLAFLARGEGEIIERLHRSERLVYSAHICGLSRVCIRRAHRILDRMGKPSGAHPDQPFPLARSAPSLCFAARSAWRAAEYGAGAPAMAGHRMNGKASKNIVASVLARLC